MKRLIAILLVLTMLPLMGMAENTDDPDAVREEDLLTAEQLAESISNADEDAAYLAWAKACTAVIIGYSNSAYDSAVGIYNYTRRSSKYADVVKAMLVEDDMWTLTISIPRNDSETTSYTSLNNAVIGYKNMLTYRDTLAALIAMKPAVPEKYAKTAEWIITAESKLNGCIATVDKWINATDMKALDFWVEMETQYWDDSVLSLKGIYYIDSRLSD